MVKCWVTIKKKWGGDLERGENGAACPNQSSAESSWKDQDGVAVLADMEDAFPLKG